MIIIGNDFYIYLHFTLFDLISYIFHYYVDYYVDLAFNNDFDSKFLNYLHFLQISLCQFWASIHHPCPPPKILIVHQIEELWSVDMKYYLVEILFL